jgi:hypothetical protein
MSVEREARCLSVGVLFWTIRFGGIALLMLWAVTVTATFAPKEPQQQVQDYGCTVHPAKEHSASICEVADEGVRRRCTNVRI